MDDPHQIQLKNILTFHQPTGPEIPLVFDSPHSGRIYPSEFDFICSEKALRQTDDLYVEEFFQHVPRLGASFLEAHFSRSFVDVNRSDLDIDPLLLVEKWPGKIELSKKGHLGLGVIRRLNKPHDPVYAAPLTVADIQNRLSLYYYPYHEFLYRTVHRLKENYGAVWVINCHSMPSLKFLLGRAHRREADFVIGDRKGEASSAEFTDLIASFLRDKGYEVSINAPYQGVEIVRRYGRPAQQQHAIQLEINKKLYMDEKTLEKHQGFIGLQKDLYDFSVFIAEWVRAKSQNSSD